MVNAVVPAAAVPVENGSEVWEIAVEVDILGIGPSTGPTIQQVTLKYLDLKSNLKVLEGNI